MYSDNGTKGAPCPPAAISIVLKFDTTVHPISYAIIDGSPICNVDLLNSPTSFGI